MTEFNSVIVFDSETTSLPSLDHRTTRMTELAFLGCEIKHLRGLTLPRVLHKLVLCFNPGKAISQKSSGITGLTNELLENLMIFNEKDVRILEDFITRLPSPVCIVAHNGDNFDFPILRRAFQNHHRAFPDNVYCVDSVKFFRQLYPRSTRVRNTIQQINETTPRKVTEPRNALNYKVCRELFPEHEELSQWVSSQEENGTLDVPMEPDRPKSCCLEDLYQFLHKRDLENGHTAEEDAIALLSCLIRSEGFWDWAKTNAVLLNAILPLR